MNSASPNLGIGLRILSGMMAAGMYICVKAVSETIPLGEIVFFRSFFALVPLIVFLWLRKEFPGGLATKRPVGHLLRSALGTLALFTSFAAIARLNTAEAVLIAQLAPVMLAVAAVPLLSEKLTKWRIGGLTLGFLGVVILVAPELTAQNSEGSRLTGYAIGLLSAALSALALIMVRNLNKTESPGAIALYFVLVSMVASLFTLPWGWVMPDSQTFVLLAMAGIFGGFAHIAMTLAFRYAEASRLAPFEYVALIWLIAADLIIFNLPLNTAFLIATPFIIGGAFFAALEGLKKRRA